MPSDSKGELLSFSCKQLLIKSKEKTLVDVAFSFEKSFALIGESGSGKSLTAFWITKELKANKIIIAVPSLALIKQTLDVWTRESLANNLDINWIVVCSDESVAKKDEDIFTSSIACTNLCTF